MGDNYVPNAAVVNQSLAWIVNALRIVMYARHLVYLNGVIDRTYEYNSVIMMTVLYRSHFMRTTVLCLSVTALGIWQCAVAKDSYWECTNSDGTVETSVLKCEKGQKSKLIVIDSAANANGSASMALAPPPPSQQGTYAAPSNCLKPPSYCDHLAGTVRRDATGRYVLDKTGTPKDMNQSLECNVFRMKYLRCLNVSVR
ncbi:MAG: hypothetical protein PHY45_08725 [Rhodocyclaceae bacterium]|nr:hypothetical protein [Rhodocyclaceae bacterium]